MVDCVLDASMAACWPGVSTATLRGFARCAAAMVTVSTPFS
jgi:hypothetical protein